MMRLSVLVAVTVVAAACAPTITPGHQSPGADAQLAADLSSLLLSPAEIDAAMGATGMVVDTTKSTLVDDSAYTDPVACLAISSMGQEHVYANSQWRAVRLQSLHEPGEDFEHLAHQAVVEFPDAGAATAFYTGSISSWQACASGRYTYSPGADQPVAIWQTSLVDDHAGMLTASITQQDGDGWGCRRALTAAANVVADILTCSYTDRDDAATIARHIASRVLGLRAACDHRQCRRPLWHSVFQC